VIVPRPDQAGDLDEAGPGEALPSRWRRDDRLGFHDEGEFPRRPIWHEIAVVAAIPARVPRFLPDLQAAQPLDVHVPFVAGEQEPQWEALGGVQVFAVDGIDEQPIGHRLGGGDAPVETDGVGSLRQDPRPARLDLDFPQDGGERHAGPFGTVGPAVRLLRRLPHRGF
jgi:hypothetical protein